MSTLMQANHQWSTRPDDERFVTLIDMHQAVADYRHNSREKFVSSRVLEAVPSTDNKGLLIQGANGTGYAPTNWAFNQLAGLSGSPAGYLRTLPSPLAADCLNYGLRFNREPSDLGVLLRKHSDNANSGGVLMAACSWRRAHGGYVRTLWTRME